MARAKFALISTSDVEASCPDADGRPLSKNMVWLVGLGVMIVGLASASFFRHSPMPAAAAITDTMQAVSTCDDTPGWTNGAGQGCAFFAKYSFCQDSSVNLSLRQEPAWSTTFGVRWNEPEKNCCICGGGKWTDQATPMAPLAEALPALANATMVDTNLSGLTPVGSAASLPPVVVTPTRNVGNTSLLHGSTGVPQLPENCHDVTDGEGKRAFQMCYKNVLWAMMTGIHTQLQWYAGYPVDINSSFNDFQGVLYAKRALAMNGALDQGWRCPRPCNMSVILNEFLSNSACHVVVATDTFPRWKECYRNVVWAMNTGIQSSMKTPYYGNYNLSADSTFEEFQAVLWSKKNDVLPNDGKGWDCPKPCNASVAGVSDVANQMRSIEVTEPVTAVSGNSSYNGNTTSPNHSDQWIQLAVVAVAVVLLLGLAFGFWKLCRRSTVKRSVDLSRASREKTGGVRDSDETTISADAYPVQTAERVATSTAPVAMYSFPAGTGLTPPAGLFDYTMPIPLVPVYAPPDSVSFSSPDQSSYCDDGMSPLRSGWTPRIQ